MTVRADVRVSARRRACPICERVILVGARYLRAYTARRRPTQGPARISLCLRCARDFFALEGDEVVAAALATPTVRKGINRC